MNKVFLPQTDDVLDQLGKSTYFMSPDLASGYYWQIPATPIHANKPAFRTQHGFFCFDRYAFQYVECLKYFWMEILISGSNSPKGCSLSA
jgi:hypothetical protein